MSRTPPFTDTVLPDLVTCARSCRLAIDGTGWGVSAAYDIGMQPVSSLDYDDSPWPSELHRGFRHYIWDFGLDASVQDDYYWSLEPESSTPAQDVIGTNGFIARGMWGTGTDPAPSEAYWATHSPSGAIVSLLLEMLGTGSTSSVILSVTPPVPSGLLCYQRAIAVYDATPDLIGVVRAVDYYRGTYGSNPPYDELDMIVDGSVDVERLYSPDFSRIRISMEEAWSVAQNITPARSRLGAIWSVRGAE